MYESQITFTMDFICPCLDIALSRVRASLSSSTISFTTHFSPYQLYPSHPPVIESRKAWALHNKHADNTAAQEAFHTHMASLFAPLDVALTDTGPTGNTLLAHRVLQSVQEGHGDEVAGRLVDVLYRMYFVEGRGPAGEDVLREACGEVGLEKGEVEGLVEGKEGMSERDVKAMLKVVAMDVDAVPVVVVEGKRRDVTLTGAKEVEEYVKALEMVVKDSS